MKGTDFDPEPPKTPERVSLPIRETQSRAAKHKYRTRSGQLGLPGQSVPATEISSFSGRHEETTTTTVVADAASQPSRPKRQRTTRSIHKPSPPPRKKRKDLGVPPDQALFVIKSSWRLRALLDILPPHAYKPGTQHLANPFGQHPALLMALYELALRTRDCGERVGRELGEAFGGCEGFDEGVAVEVVEGLVRGYREGGCGSVELPDGA